MRVLVYSDGQTASQKALDFAARMTQTLDADLAVITVRSGTYATEPTPPYGQNVNLSDRAGLPKGLQILVDSVAALTQNGLLKPQTAVRISELPNGHLFVGQSQMGKRIPFYVCFGQLIETLNHEIDKHHYDLLIIAPPKRSRFHKMVLGDTTRKLILDLHASVLIVRGGGPYSRFATCVDGSPAARRQLAMLNKILPLMMHPLDLIWVQTPTLEKSNAEIAEHFLESCGQWLRSVGTPYTMTKLKGKDRAAIICSTVGDDVVLLLGGSLRHDVYRRLMGSLPMQILALTTASVLVVKGLPDGEPDLFTD